jgi:hypothetical protein
MSKFLYLFWNNEGLSKSISPERMQELTKVWMSWMAELKQAGHVVQTGERLDCTGKMVRGKAKTVIDGPYAEAKDTIGGYLIIQATDLAQAVELAKGCPVLLGDGLVEVRPIIS